MTLNIKYFSNINFEVKEIKQEVNDLKQQENFQI